MSPTTESLQQMIDLRKALELWAKKGLDHPECVRVVCSRSTEDEICAVLDAPYPSEMGEVWWCEAHVSNGPKENGEHGPCWFVHFADVMRRHAGSTTKHGLCRMVSNLLVDPQEGDG